MLNWCKFGAFYMYEYSLTWTDQCQIAFVTLEDAPMKSLILVYPDPSKPYTLFMDASKYA